MPDLFQSEKPDWYKDAIIYEVHIKSYFDANQDGMGDFQGLLQKLDYLEDLGITAVWLLPFYTSPLRDDGYDIADYTGINTDYGTIQDFKEFLKGAHQRGIKVITELVLNHTSDQHPWFERARKARKGSKFRNFYVWSDSPEKFKDARVIFKDFETSNWTWDSEAGAYYWHRFYHHQPDLNFENPAVQAEIFKVVDFWFGLGVDGLRLDAVPYLFEKEGTNCENLPETHDFLKKLRAYTDKKYVSKMFIAEANQWPEDAVAYFGEGDECQLAFHFPIMPRVFMSMKMEDRFPLIDILEQTPDIPDNCQWALFLRNHDELTLEMVTDEERDYMYRVYAQDPRSRINLGIRRRLASLLGNDRRKIELANILLFSLPGTPVIYYGDEIGMGDNYYLGDRDGVRTPMQWSPDRNAGFSMVNPQKLYLPVIIDPETHYESVNVENQQRNTTSLLWWMKKMIAVRKQYPILGRGNLRFLLLDNPKVIAFSRSLETETMIIVINLSRMAQVAEVDLSAYTGMLPREVFSQNTFPIIRDEPYVFTMGPYDYFWFILEKETGAVRPSSNKPDYLKVGGSWTRILKDKGKDIFEQKMLPPFLRNSVWFQGKERHLRDIKIEDMIRIGRIREQHESFYQLLIQVNYIEGEAEYYQLIVSFLTGLAAEQIVVQYPRSLIGYLMTVEGEGVLYDAVYNKDCRALILENLLKKKRLKSGTAALNYYTRRTVHNISSETVSTILKKDRHNTSILFGDQYFLKLYRRVDAETNPEVEIIHYLSQKKRHLHVPRYLGEINYKNNAIKPFTLGLLEAYISHESDGWSYSLDLATRYFDRLLSQRFGWHEIPVFPKSLLKVGREDVPSIIKELSDTYYFEFAYLLGQRTAEMHLQLMSVQDSAFKPEPFSQLYQRSLYQSMQGKVRRLDQNLFHRIDGIPGELQEVIRNILNHKDRVFELMKRIMDGKIEGMKIRIHNEYHLGQVLYTGKDVVIIDFEGHPDTALSERRLKRSPLRDVVGMVRSFQYVVYHALLHHPSISPEDLQLLIPWAELWYAYASALFLRAYQDTVKKSGLIPGDESKLSTLFDAFMLESLFDELEYHLQQDERMVIVPIQGINRVLESNGD